MARTSDKLMLAVGSVSLHMGLSMGLLEGPHNMVNGLPTAIDPRDHDESCNAFPAIALQSPLPYCIGHTGPSLFQCGRGLHRHEGPLGAGSLCPCTQLTLVALHSSWLRFVHSCFLQLVKKRR